MKKWLVAVATAAGLAAVYGHASAAPLQFSEIQAKHRQTQKYTCATGRILHVTYWNTANGQSFALVPVKGKQLLFVNTIVGVRREISGRQLHLVDQGPARRPV